MNRDTIRDVLRAEIETLTRGLIDMGENAEAALRELQEEAVKEANDLSRVVGQPGWDHAANAAALRLQLFAANRIVDQADQLDERAGQAWLTAVAAVLRFSVGVIAAL